MKAKRLIPCLWAFFYAAAISLSSIYCLTSSFGYPVESELIPAALSAAALFALLTLLQSRRVSLILSLAVFAPALYAPVREALVGGMFRMAGIVLEPVSAFYPFIAPAADYCALMGTGSCLVFLILLAAAQSLVLCRFITDGDRLWPAMLLPLAVITPCFFIVEALPDLQPLMIFVAATALLVLTQQQRSHTQWAGARLSLIMAVPVLALTILIAAIWPKDTYERPQWPDETREELIYRVSTAAAKLTESAPEPVVSADSPVTAVVEVYEEDLTKAGPRQYFGVQVMQINAPDGGPVYLRGASFAKYRDSVWYSPDPDSTPELNFSSITATASGSSVSSMSVRTVDESSRLYTPYHLYAMPEGAVTVNDSYVFHSDEPRQYTLEFCQTATDSTALPPAYEQYVSEYYTQVPDELWDELFPIAYDIGLFDLSTAERPMAVAAYIKGCARYDLNTTAVPDGKDFVLWFLQESETGYCVHFATAACMLLRTADIPARYVTGYLASAKADQWSPVHDYAAHAWVEYYVPGTGWLPLEATPPADNTASVVPEIEETPQISEQLPIESETPPEISTQPTNSGAEVIGGSDAPTSIVVKRSVPLWPLIVILAAAFPFARRYTVMAYRKKRSDRCGLNSKALLVWTRIVKLSAALGAEEDKGLFALAQKARFSQHTISIDELAAMEAHYAALTVQAEQAPLPKRLWYRFVLIVY